MQLPVHFHTRLLDTAPSVPNYPGSDSSCSWVLQVETNIYYLSFSFLTNIFQLPASISAVSAAEIRGASSQAFVNGPGLPVTRVKDDWQ